MKKVFLAAVLSLFAVCVEAGVPPQPSPTGDYNPTVMLGVAYNFSGAPSSKNFGFTAKLLSTNEEKAWVGALGATWYPWSGEKFGFDLSGGYNFTNSTALIGYDFIKSQFQVSGGWTDTKTADQCPGDYVFDDGSCLPLLSDIRLKREIKLLTTLDNGMKIYSFKYNWSDTTYVGVMAQDLLENPLWRDAVITRKDGFYAVNYTMLGLKMVTLDEWERGGIASIYMGTREPLAMVMK